MIVSVWVCFTLIAILPHMTSFCQSHLGNRIRFSFSFRFSMFGKVGYKRCNHTIHINAYMFSEIAYVNVSYIILLSECTFDLLCLVCYWCDDDDDDHGHNRRPGFFTWMFSWLFCCFYFLQKWTYQPYVLYAVCTCTCTLHTSSMHVISVCFSFLFVFFSFLSSNFIRNRLKFLN